MRFIIILIMGIGLTACNSTMTKAEIDFAENPVIAHRGAWKAKNLPKNSIASLKEAIRLKCTGAEFDVRMTLDEVLIVTHDADFNGLDIETSTYEQLSKYKLSNGETLPTLEDYILAGMTDNTTTGLVCELKPTSAKERDILMAKKAVALVKDLKAEAYVSYYISFSYEILKQIKALDANSKVMYLDGSKTPSELEKDGITGLDYYYGIFKENPNWIKQANELNLKLNAWTVNNKEDIDWILTQNFDFITTDEPELTFKRIEMLTSKEE